MTLNLKYSPAWSFQGRYKLRQNRESPGPGAYEIYSPKASPKYRIGTASRITRSSYLSKSPGPGAYDPKPTFSSTGLLLGTGKRSPLSPKQMTPGPGAYEVNGSYQGPKFTMRGKTRLFQKDAVPGPGQYNPKKPDTAPSYSLGSAGKSSYIKIEKDLPGPGMYDSKIKKSTPSWTFRSERWLKREQIALPGPGTYEIPTTVGAISKYALSP